MDSESKKGYGLSSIISLLAAIANQGCENVTVRKFKTFRRSLSGRQVSASTMKKI